MRPASDLERRRVNDLFARLCAIPSPSLHEGAIAGLVRDELTALGLQVHEDDAGERIGGQSGNLLTRMAGRDGDGGRSILLCAHLDTVPLAGGSGAAPVSPVIRDGHWVNERDDILGADNKAAVAMLLALAHRVAVEGAPIGIELLFTVSEETGLRGAANFDVARLASSHGFVFDHATPVGEVVVASPTHHSFVAEFRGAAAHAGVRPESGRSAVLAAAHAIASMPLGRIDEETTANVGAISGGTAANVVPERCRVAGEVRSLSDSRGQEVLAEIVDRCQDAAGRSECQCDLDVTIDRMFAGYRHAGTAPGVRQAEAALRTCGHEPKRVSSGGGSDANALVAAGFPCTNVANGTERPHEPGESVAVVALEAMLDVVFALVDAAADDPGD